MKTYDRCKTSDEIKAACQAAGYRIDTSKYEAGSDFINFDFHFEGVKRVVVYNTCNGRFFGELDNGEMFNSDSDQHDNEPWFIALLDFVYVADEKAA